VGLPSGSALDCGVARVEIVFPLFGRLATGINTGTTVITFLVVFLIHNRDARAIHLKLDEIIVHRPGGERNDEYRTSLGRGVVSRAAIRFFMWLMWRLLESMRCVQTASPAGELSLDLQSQTAS
jgi:hypothetical protein